MTPLAPDFFQRDPVVCARELIGMELVWNGCGGIVVETEAYADQGDPACHTMFRPSARQFIREASPGTAYVYLNYGMHWLTNVLVKGGSANGFVLIRALQPTRGIPEMRQRRRKDRLTHLCSGPGKLSAALGLSSAHHGTSLVHSSNGGFFLGPVTPEVASCVRIGISKAIDLPWRFLAAGSEFVSVKPRVATPIQEDRATRPGSPRAKKPKQKNPDAATPGPDLRAPD